MNILLGFRKGTNYNDYLMQYIFLILHTVGRKEKYVHFAKPKWHIIIIA